MSKLRKGLADIFEIDVSELHSDSRLEEFAWDSLSMVSTIALFDELFNKELTLAAMETCSTIGDLEKLAGE